MRYFARHIPIPYQIYACTPSPAEKYRDLFHFASDYEPQVKVPTHSHPVKLNFLTAEILKEADDEDLILYIDGDAFPIADFLPFVTAQLPTHRLIAVRRDENSGDIQPHPSFCITTAGFWREIGGDWCPGYRWKNSEGAMITDVGGNLLEKVQGKWEWYPLLRSNKVELHPLWFGIYGDIVYHHGAGFRKPTSRIDGARHRVNKKEKRKKSRVARHLPPIVKRGISFAKIKMGIGDERYEDSIEYQRCVRLMDDVFDRITHDEEFFLMFQDPEYRFPRQ